ncbi:MAG TPA: hypothetical protein VFX16_28040 [Pseudonocardiaceae bacterium]|nr:hypothetical protein [Pseudonocardiaceae bacterium]
MVNGNLSIGEQYTDRRTKIEMFRGREIESVTARVVLHALDELGRPICGSGDELTPTGQRWHRGYLPHLPRCQTCAARAGATEHTTPDVTIDIRTAHGTDDENAASAALRAVLADHDVRRWIFTDLVIVDETMRGGLSHPLTIGPRLLVRRPTLALTSFLHEQLHWLDEPGTDSATAEAAARWPDPPSFDEGGAADPTSTWLHLIVCALEHQSLSEFVGPAAAAAELRQHTGYRWIYGQILAEPDWFADFLQRHGLRVPDLRPVPRRYVGDPL